MMKKVIPAASPDAYVDALSGWQLKQVKQLREAVKAAAKLEEVIRWGHLVYFSNGQMTLIRAEEKRVLFGFFRGKQLTDIEPRLIPGGKYDLATMTLHEDTEITAATVKKLVKAAIALNAKLGDPTKAAKSK